MWVKVHLVIKVNVGGFFSLLNSPLDQASAHALFISKVPVTYIVTH